MLKSITNEKGFQAKPEIDVQAKTGAVSHKTVTAKRGNDLYILSGRRALYDGYSLAGTDCSPPAAESLLWVPPSIPYYQPGGVFKDKGGFSKVLVFSAWEMVPRMIACTLSYECERRTISKLYGKELNTFGKGYLTEDSDKRHRRFPTPRLVDGRDCAITKASVILADIFSPIGFMGQSIPQIKRSLRPLVEARLTELQTEHDFPTRRGRRELNMAITSPAICAMRVMGGDRNLAERLAKEVAGIFDKPEAIVVIELAYGKGDDAYYKNIKKSQIRMRFHFVAGFYQTKGDEKTSQRKENLRTAFNAPFRPSVLATTSIGQEGLDFHHYTRKIMHWNLPHNPIDLEQREGRINRYKCFAIRQSLARKFKDIDFTQDVWDELFQFALDAKRDADPELVPYWCLPEDAAVKIERIVPMYPYSKDKAVYDKLLKILSLYRVTMGQARQEELLEYLFNNRDSDELKELFINLSPITKEPATVGIISLFTEKIE